MIRSNSNIKLSNEILEEVASELGIEIGKVKYGYSAMVKYLEHLAENTDAVSISLPHLGTMYMKGRDVKERESTLKGGKDEGKYEVYKAKLSTLNTFYKKYYSKTTTMKSRHEQRLLFRKHLRGKYATKDDSEFLQNNM